MKNEEESYGGVEGDPEGIYSMNRLASVPIDEVDEYLAKLLKQNY